MYCKSCHYDLRGQVEPRCPECGRGFDRTDPTTFDAEVIGPLRRVWLASARARNGRVLILILMPVLALGYAVLAPSAVHRGPSPSLAAMSKLKTFLIVWQIYQDEHPGQRAFPRDLALEEAAGAATTSTSLFGSPLGCIYGFEQRMCERYASSAQKLLWPILAYACLVALLVNSHKAARRAWRIAVFVGIVLVLSYVIPWYFALISGTSHNCIDDYVYRDGVEMTSESPGNDLIVAYSRRPMAGRWIVGFADGHTQALPDGDFRARAAAQGITVETE